MSMMSLETLFYIMGYTSILMLIICMISHILILINAFKYCVNTLMGIYSEKKRNDMLTQYYGYKTFIYTTISMATYNIFFLYFPETVENHTSDIFEWTGYTIHLTSLYFFFLVLSLFALVWSYHLRKKLLKTCNQSEIGV